MSKSTYNKVPTRVFATQNLRHISKTKFTNYKKILFLFQPLWRNKYSIIIKIYLSTVRTCAYMYVKAELQNLHWDTLKSIINTFYY